jgi:enoyl-CoA hydratase
MIAPADPATDPRTMDDSSYQHLRFEHRAHGVLLVTIDRPERYNATDRVLHSELARVWKDVDADPGTRVAVVTGAGKAFSAGGDLDMIDDLAGSYKNISEMTRETVDVVLTLVDCCKPVISAINGVAVGAGLAVALLADISIIAQEARLSDGHLRLGVGAGDHAAIIWPLLCGLAKAKYYLMTAEFMDGAEAERIGLVSRCVPRDELMDTALGVAERLATGPQHAVRFTKRTLNHWVRQAAPIFEHSAALEMLTFFGEDVTEGAQAVREKRAPRFPTAGA